jgi:hypothetical protein
MKEIISLQVGQSGCRVGNQFWNNMAQEHLSGKLDE